MTRRIAALTVALAMATSVGCAKTTRNADGGTVPLPNKVTVIIPAGSQMPDIPRMIGDDVVAVQVLSVDPTGASTLLADVDLSGGKLANPELREAARANGLQKLTNLVVPQGTGYGDIFAAARQTSEQSEKQRIVAVHSGCLEVAGARLTGADLSTAEAINTVADSLVSAGTVAFEPESTVILAGASGCSENSADSQARLAVLRELCRRASAPCVAREGEVAR